MGGRQRCRHRVGARRYRARRSISMRAVDTLTVRRAGTVSRPRSRSGAIPEACACTYIYMCGANGREPNGRDRSCSAGADREVAPPPRGPLVTEAVSRRLREFVWIRCKPATAARHRPETGRHMLPGFDCTPFAAIGREHGPASGTGRAAVRSPRTWRYSPLSRTIGDAADRGPMPARGSLCRFPRTYRTRRNGIPTLRSEGPDRGLP